MWRGTLSVRRLSVLVAHLPRESAVGLLQAGPYAGWTTEAVLIADLYAVWAGQPHPALPKKNATTPAVARAHRERLLEQQRRLGGQQK